MALTRREFLGYTAGAVGILRLAMRARGPGELPPDLRRWYTVYSDPSAYDTESMRGYWSALPDEWRVSPGRGTPLAFLLVPSCISLLPPMVKGLRVALESGTTVVMETGAGFANNRAFRQHRRWLREQLEIHVLPRVDLWQSPSTPRGPYIEFTWPRRAKIRDFSRVVPPAEQPGEIIAWAGDLPVAFRRRVGKGTLIYLGSPVGPALWAGDVEARRWLYTVALAA